MGSMKRILIVDDSPEDVEMIMTALKDGHIANELVGLADGAIALDYLQGRGPYQDGPTDLPAVVLLDIHMPKVDGLEVLRTIRQDPRLQVLPVVILTSSKQERDIVEGYRLGANAYVIKPVAVEEFMDAVRQLGLFWAVFNEPPPKVRRAA